MQKNNANRLGLAAIGWCILILIIATIILFVTKGEVSSATAFGFAFSKTWFVLLAILAVAAPFVYAYLVYKDSAIVQTQGKVFVFLIAIGLWFITLGYVAGFKVNGASDPNKKHQLNEYLIKQGKPTIK